MQSRSDSSIDYNAMFSTKNTFEFKNDIDYKEASDPKKIDKTVIFGSRKFEMQAYINDIDNKGESSPYIGRIFYPERVARTDGNAWSYEKNMAFWAGIIDANRPLVLLTDIACYPKKNYEEALSYTIHEILWLVDNGYKLKVNKNNPTTTALVPPAKPREIRQLTDYFAYNKDDLLKKFIKIKDQVLLERQKIAGQALAKMPPKVPAAPKQDSNTSVAQSKSSLWQGQKGASSSQSGPSNVNSSGNKRKYDGTGTQQSSSKRNAN